MRLAWADITQAQVPPDPGSAMEGYYAAMSSVGSLSVAGQDLPYNLPLSFSPDCLAFLEALEAKTQVVPVQRKQ